ncbi:hypothetical protein B0A55_06053 [Friedmanniomyces simplex]|uniref:Uncharacterized protein n=1 Tax=Friedmanniomyces simplex TaxID=329884 RepID=A0A4U0XAV2_9PEZI|nr:hypothetical protein B0A55_06053 [Friedmanniomyces simplex]
MQTTCSAIVRIPPTRAEEWRTTAVDSKKARGIPGADETAADALRKAQQTDEKIDILDSEVDLVSERLDRIDSTLDSADRLAITRFNFLAAKIQALSEMMWRAHVYVVNDTTAPLHTTQNKGREANAYLTYILEHYHDLPEIAVFVHAHRNGYPQAWHTEGAGNDIVDSLRRLNTAYAEAEGYTNLRCNHNPGCSVDGRIQPHHHLNDPRPWDRDAAAAVAWLDAWPKLFPGMVLPQEIAAPCCAQFAVTRRQIQQRPLTDYQRFHDWLMRTELSDDISGRVMEYAWHIVFGKDVVQ